MRRNIGRNIASRSDAGKSWIQGDFSPLPAAKDSPSSGSSPHRISARQLDFIEGQLTDSDRAVLLFLSEVRLATGAQIARRLWASKTPSDSEAWAARRALWRLEGWRIVDRLPRRIGGVRGGSGSLIFTLGPAGRRLLARSGYRAKRLGTPGERYVRHTLAITELAVRLNEAALAGELDVIELQTEPACWRGFVGWMGARLVVKPDLFARIGAGAFEDRWFFEIDMATEASSTLIGKAKRYLAHFRSGEEQRRHGVYPRVVWTVPHAGRREHVAEALRQLPPGAQRLFAVWPYDEVAGRLAAEAGR